MPSRKELRVTLTHITDESFISCVPLTKINYTEAEANQIQLQALISYHGLMFVDEMLSIFNRSKTSFSRASVKEALKAVYSRNKTQFNRAYAITYHKHLGDGGSIGRNQAIELLLTSALEELNLVK